MVHIPESLMCHVAHFVKRLNCWLPVSIGQFSLGRQLDGAVGFSVSQQSGRRLELLTADRTAVRLGDIRLVIRLSKKHHFTFFSQNILAFDILVYDIPKQSTLKLFESFEQILDHTHIFLFVRDLRCF